MSAISNALPLTRSFNAEREFPFDLQKFDRRDPFIHFYLPVDCPAVKKCPFGFCLLAHSKLEKIFHPIVYKTQPCQKCKDGICEYLQKCAFYHDATDKEKAELAWQKWELRWDGWRQRIDSLLSKQNKAHKEIRHKVEFIMKIHKSRTSSVVSSPPILPQTLVSSPLSSPLSSASTSNPFSNRLFPPLAMNSDFLMRHSTDTPGSSTGGWSSQISDLSPFVLRMSDSNISSTFSGNGRSVITALTSPSNVNDVTSQTSNLLPGVQDFYGNAVGTKPAQTIITEYREVDTESASTGITPGSQLADQTYDPSSLWDSFKDASKGEIQAFKVAEFCFNSERASTPQDDVSNSYVDTAMQIDKQSVPLQYSPAQIALDHLFPDIPSLTPTSVSSHPSERDNRLILRGDNQFLPTEDGIESAKNEEKGASVVPPVSYNAETFNEAGPFDSVLPYFSDAIIDRLPPVGDAGSKQFVAEPMKCGENCIHKQQLERVWEKYCWMRSYIQVLERLVKEYVFSTDVAQPLSKVETRQDSATFSTYVPPSGDRTIFSSQNLASQPQAELRLAQEVELLSGSPGSSGEGDERASSRTVSPFAFTSECSPYNASSFFEYT